MGVEVGGRGLGVFVGRGGVRMAAAGSAGVLGAGSGDAGADQQAALSAPASAQAQSAVSRRLATSNPLSLRWECSYSRGMFRCLTAATRSERSAWQQ